MSDHLMNHFVDGTFVDVILGVIMQKISCHCVLEWRERLYKEHLDKDLSGTLVQCPYKCQGGGRKHKSFAQEPSQKHLKDRCVNQKTILVHVAIALWQAHDDVCPKFPLLAPISVAKKSSFENH